MIWDEVSCALHRVQPVSPVVPGGASKLTPEPGLGSLAAELDAPTLDYEAERLDALEPTTPTSPTAPTLAVPVPNGHSHSAHSSPRRAPPSPLRTPSFSNGYANGLSSRRSPSPEPERVFLTDFESTLEATESLIARLQSASDEAVELGLVSLVGKLGESERAREDGIRELTVLLREFETVRGEGLDLDLRLSELAGLGESSRVGWTGEPDVPISGFGTIEEEDETPPASPVSPTTPRSPTTPLTPHTPHTLHTPHHAQRRGLLPRHTAELAAHTLSLSASLVSILESANLSLSSIASTSARQLKGVRVGLRSFKATQEHEDECAEGVRRFEALEEAGKRPDAREEMRRIMEGFERSLEQAEEEWNRARAMA